MYTDYYALSADPFRLTPDHRFVYAHEAYARAQTGMRQALDQGEGILLLTGRAGTGKSTLAESFLADLQSDRVAVAKVLGTQLENGELLRMVAYAFGLKGSYSDRAGLLRDLESCLAGFSYALLLIDEAQNVSDSSLDELCLLANLQQASRPLLQIFLVGQEQLQERLQHAELEPIQQRLTALCELRPLELQDTFHFVLHRMACAGWHGHPAFATDAFPLLHRCSQGLPRIICKLSARVLEHCAAQEKSAVELDDVATVALEMHNELLLPLNAGGEGATIAMPADVEAILRLQELPTPQRMSLFPEEMALLESQPALMTRRPGATGQEAEPRHDGDPGDARVEQTASAPDGDSARGAGEHPDALARTGSYTNLLRERLRLASAGPLLGWGVAASLVLMAGYQLGRLDSSQQATAVRPALAAGEAPALTASTSAIAVPESPAALPVDAGRWARAVAVPATLAQGSATAGFSLLRHTPSGVIAPDESGRPVRRAAQEGDAGRAPATDAVVEIAGNDTGGSNEAPADALQPEATRPSSPPAAGQDEIALRERTSLTEAPGRSRQDPLSEMSPLAPVDASGQPHGDGSPGADTLPAAEARPEIAMVSSPAPAPAPAVAAADARQDRLQSLLAQADQAISRDRLLTPESKSAWHYLQQVFALEPEHPRALAELERITDRYAQLTEVVLERGEYDRAREFVARGLSVSASDEQLLALRRAIDDREDKARQAAIEIADSAPDPAPEPDGLFDKLKRLFGGN